MFRICLLSFVAFFAASDAAPDCSKPHPKEHFPTCCRMPASIEEPIHRCDQKFLVNEELGFCHDECIFEEIGLFVNGTILFNKVPSVIDMLFKSNPEFLQIANATWTKCEAMGKKLVPIMIQKHPETTNKCHPLPAFLAHCFVMETFMKCPASMWDTDASCNGTKEYMQKCVAEPAYAM